MSPSTHNSRKHRNDTLDSRVHWNDQHFLANERNHLTYLRAILDQLDGTRTITTRQDVRNAVREYTEYNHCLNERATKRRTVNADPKLLATFGALESWLNVYNSNVGNSRSNFYKRLTEHASRIQKENVNKMPIQSYWGFGSQTYSEETIGENIYKALVEIIHTRFSARHDAWKVDIFTCRRNQTGDIDQGKLVPAYNEARNEGRCSICLQSWANGEDLIRLRCGTARNDDKLRTRHIYHRGCIETHARNSHRCPDCRGNF